MKKVSQIHAKTNDYRRGVRKATQLACKLGRKVTLGINDERHPYARTSYGHYGGKVYVIYSGDVPPFVRPGVGVTPSPEYCAKRRHRVP